MADSGLQSEEALHRASVIESEFEKYRSRILELQVQTNSKEDENARLRKEVQMKEESYAKIEGNLSMLHVRLSARD